MTKTKAQLRAEAVERLKTMQKLEMYSVRDFAIAVEGENYNGGAWNFRDALIELLTDECDTECYACSKLAELRAENSQLRVANDVYAQEIGAADGGSAPNDIGSVSWFDILKANGVELGKAPKSSETESGVIASHNELFEALEEREADSREKPLENPQNMALQGWDHILLDAPEHQLFVLDEDAMRRLYHIGFMDCKEGQYNIPAHGLNNIEYIALSDYESKRQYRDQQKRSMDVDSENDSREKLEEIAWQYDASYAEPYEHGAIAEAIIALLDRQAAIDRKEFQTILEEIQKCVRNGSR